MAFEVPMYLCGCGATECWCRCGSGLKSRFYEVEGVAYEDSYCAAEVAGPEVGGHGRVL